MPDYPTEYPIGSKIEWEAQVNQLIEAHKNGDAAAVPAILSWFKDMNWPGAGEAHEYLRTLDKAALTPHLKHILETNDEGWRDHVILFVRHEWTAQDLRPLVDSLIAVASNPTGECDDIEAALLLAKHRLVSLPAIQSILSRLREFYADHEWTKREIELDGLDELSELTELDRLIKNWGVTPAN